MQLSLYYRLVTVVNHKINLLLLGFFWLLTPRLMAQTLGGSAAYSFLRFPASPQLAALGGVNVAHATKDVSLAVQNPALLDASMHAQMATNFNSLYDGVKNYHWMLGYRHPGLATNFSASLQFFDYGSITQTDAAGTVFGNLRPRDLVFQLTASRSYLEKWNYGLTLKWIASNYGMYRSQAAAVDVGLLYKDTARFFQAGITVKNMGVQVRRYNSAISEELPFDLVLGVYKQLENAPIRFSFTAHHLHQFDIDYNDPAFNAEMGVPAVNNRKFTINKLFRHFVLSTQLLIGQKVEVTAGYNFLRRNELRIPNVANGLTGFSLGVGAMLPKLQIRYARTYFQNTTAYNQLGLNLPLNLYFGLGKWGEKIGW